MHETRLCVCLQGPQAERAVPCCLLGWLGLAVGDFTGEEIGLALAISALASHAETVPVQVWRASSPTVGC